MCVCMRKREKGKDGEEKGEGMKVTQRGRCAVFCVTAVISKQMRMNESRLRAVDLAVFKHRA